MAVTENIANMSINKFDVQSKLGEETAESKFVYELYLTSQSMPKYKYRICFIYYGVLLYPVGISLEKEIANELGVPNAEFTVDTQDDFEEYLRRILGSKKVTLLIQNLYRIGRGETKYPRVIERRE